MRNRIEQKDLIRIGKGEKLITRIKKSILCMDLMAGFTLAIFIISFSIVVVLFTKPLFYWDISIFHLENSSGLHSNIIRKNYDIMIRYFIFWNRETLILPNFSMSEAGKMHFEECKELFNLIQFICLGSFFFLALVLMWKKRFIKERKVDRNEGGVTQVRLFSSGLLLISGLLLTGIPTLIGIAALNDWEGLFISFHKLVFSNNYWLFDPATDPVILILPDGFFFQCLAVILVMVIGSGLICIARAIKIRKVDKYG